MVIFIIKVTLSIFINQIFDSKELKPSLSKKIEDHLIKFEGLRPSDGTQFIIMWGANAHSDPNKVNTEILVGAPPGADPKSFVRSIETINNVVSSEITESAKATRSTIRNIKVISGIDSYCNVFAPLLL